MSDNDVGGERKRGKVVLISSIGMMQTIDFSSNRPNPFSVAPCTIRNTLASEDLARKKYIRCW